MRLFLCLIASFFFANITQSQVELGIKAGLNSIDLVSNSIEVNDGINNLSIAFNDSQYGHHFGLYTRIKAFGIYLEPGAIFNSNKVSYTIEEYSEKGVISSIKNETYRNLDIPMMVGIKAGFFRLFGGPVAHLHLNSSSELLQLKGYKQKFKDATYGYQAGFGFDIRKIRIELAYEGNLSNFGSHITIDGQPYTFSESASRIIGSIGYAF